jgi:erythromycin esterase-like protein
MTGADRRNANGCAGAVRQCRGTIPPSRAEGVHAVLRYRCARCRTLRAARLERAIGVIYRPDTERQSHYFQARVADQFDAVVHIDDTRAVEPLERTAGWEQGEAPETYPFAV